MKIQFSLKLMVMGLVALLSTPVTVMATRPADYAIAEFKAGYNAPSLDLMSLNVDDMDKCEQAALARALASARDASPDAVVRLEEFMVDYPGSPARPYVLLTMGNCLMDKGSYVDALDCYNLIGAGALDPMTDASCRLAQGIALLSMGKLAQADRQFSSLADTSKRDAARFYRGYIAYENGDYDTARAFFDRVVGLSMPEGLSPWYLAQIYYRDGNYKKALDTSARLLTNDEIPDNYKMEANRIAGESLYMLDHRAQAVKYLEKYLSQTGEEAVPSASYILGMCRYADGDYRGSIGMLQRPATLADPMGQNALLTMGRCYMALGDSNAAAIALERAAASTADPSVAEEAAYNLCVVRSDGGRMPFANAAAAYEDFVNRFSGSKHVGQVSEYLALGYIDCDNYPAALTSLERIKVRTPELDRALQQVLYTMGMRDLEAGNIDGAESYLNRARTIDNRDAGITAECELLLADCYYKRGDYTRAAKGYGDYLAQATAATPNKALAVYNLGYSRFGLQDFNGASKAFKQYTATKGIPVDMEADALDRLGDCLYAVKDLDGALRAYDRAASVHPATADYAMYRRAVIEGWRGRSASLIEGLESMIKLFPSSPLVPSALLDIAETHANASRIDKALDTYRKVERRYPSTEYSRRAMLLEGSLLAGEGRDDEAYRVYSKLIRENAPSAEATNAARYMQALAAENGRLDDYLKFMASVPNAPRLDASSLERDMFNAARTPRRWQEYIDKYPSGEYVAQALLLLAQDAAANGDSERAIELAQRLYDGYPDGETAPDALKVLADAQMALGKVPDALDNYSRLEMRASDAVMLNHSRRGILNASRDLGHWDDVVIVADKLLESSTTRTSGSDGDILFLKAVALSNTGRVDDATEIWERLSANPAELNGAKSLYYLAQHYYDAGHYEQARKAVDRLTGSNTPHSYWLARGYILTSDLYRVEGDAFSADEYLKTLRDNYPGSEPDIMNMIESRLAKK